MVRVRGADSAVRRREGRRQSDGRGHLGEKGGWRVVGTKQEIQAERQQPRHRVLSFLVALAERGEHRPAEGARPCVGGRSRADHREGVRGRGHIRHQGRPTGIPADAVGGRENPSEHSHHVEDRPAGSRQVRAGDGEEGNPRRGVRDTPAGGEHPDGGTRGNPR